MFTKYSNRFQVLELLFIDLTIADRKLQNESNILLESPANMKQTFNCFDCTM